MFKRGVRENSMKNARLGAARLFAAAALVCAAGSSFAQSVESFYKGKTVQIMIGYGPGGTDDTWARLIARFLPDPRPPP